MIKSIREQFWFIKGFLKKYSRQILVSIGITVSLAIIGNYFFSKMPHSKRQYRIGIVGQFGAGQLPPYITRFINGGLVSLDDKLQPQPALAHKWEISEDGKVYTFYLKPDLRWSTGEPVKASDINISIPNINIETQDPDVIRFTIPTPFSPFVSLLNVPLLNKEGKTIGQYDIQLKQKNTGVISQITLESKDKLLIFNVFQTPKQALTAFKLGHVDLVLNLPSEYETDAQSYGIIRKFNDLKRVVMIIFNQLDPNLKDKNTRQGIAYSLKDKVFGETEALTTIAPESWAFNPLVKTYPYNPQRVKDLISAPITLELATNPEHLTIAESIRNQLDSELVTINTRVVTSTPDQFQLYLTSYNIPNDPDQYRDWHSTQATNIGRGADEKIDKLLEDGRITGDAKDRKSIYFDFQKTFAEELPALVLYHPTVFDLARKEELFGVINSH